MAHDKAYFRMVGLALLPALGVSVDRISQLLFFPTFLAACYSIHRHLHT